MCKVGRISFDMTVWTRDACFGLGLLNPKIPVSSEIMGFAIFADIAYISDLPIA